MIPPVLDLYKSLHLFWLQITIQISNYLRVVLTSYGNFRMKKSRTFVFQINTGGIT